MYAAAAAVAVADAAVAVADAAAADALLLLLLLTRSLRGPHSLPLEKDGDTAALQPFYK